mmetsp:Transcript_30763/g.65972  ORF Transcript_30763/g.65972 Transcript_30763/m.65972 type:complete len:437 (+) Transcript_30763:221-1531(+)
MNESINQINQPPSSHRQEADRLLVAGRHGRDLGGKVVGLLFDSFADHQPAESDHLRVVLVEQLLDGHVAVLYVVLRDEALFFEEFADAALDHLFDDGLRLAAVEGLLRKDALFVLEDVLWDIIGGGKGWVHGSDVHGNVGTEFFGTSLDFNKDTNGSHVDISSHGGGSVSTGLHASDLDVFADLRHEGLSGRFEGFSVDFGVHQVVNALGTSHSGGGSRDAFAVSQERSILSDEIGFAVDLNHDGLSVASSADGNLAFGGDTRGLLVGLCQSLLSQEFGGGLLVSTGLGKGLFTVHHTGTGKITEGLDGFGGDLASGGGGGSFLGRSCLGNGFGGGLRRSGGSGFAGGGGLGGTGLVGGTGFLAGGLGGGEFRDGGLVGGGLGGLVGGSGNGFFGFAFDLVVLASEVGINGEVISLGLCLDLSDHGLSELPLALLD